MDCEWNVSTGSSSQTLSFFNSMHHLWNIQWNENGLFTGTINAGRCTEAQNGQDDYNLKSLKEYLLLRIIINYYSINNIFLGLCVFACMDKYALYFNF